MTIPTMRRRLAAPLACLAVASIIAPATRAQQSSSAGKPGKKSAIVKAAEPFPDENTMTARRVDADARRLFADRAPLAFTLTADFRTVNRDRTPESPRRYAAVLSTGGGERLHVNLGTRGHFRLMARNCDFVPLRVEFKKDEIAGTVFDGQSALKLGTHCREENAYEQYTLREFLTYRLFNLVTPRSFRARLARASYVDEKSNKPLATRYGLFLEDEDDVARRLGGREVALQRIEFKDLDPDALTTMMLFEYMIGNTDYSIWARHNVRIVQDSKRTLIPVPYDFDISGLVNPPYATPDRRLKITKVTDRLYRGPCRTVAEFDHAAEAFRAHRAEMLSLIDGLADLEPTGKAEMKDYLGGFFKTIERPSAIDKALVSGCKAQPTM